MDSISAVAFELAPTAKIGANSIIGGSGGGGGAVPAVFDVAGFSAAYSAAAHAPHQAAEVQRISSSEQNSFRSVMATLENLNSHADTLGADVARMQAQNGDLRPGDMLMMTVKAEEFLFHCELTSNVSNRTSEGVQQLFQQQS
jgi:hypothetical protein